MIVRFCDSCVADTVFSRFGPMDLVCRTCGMFLEDEDADDSDAFRYEEALA